MSNSQTEPTPIAAGDTLTVSCAVGSRPGLEVGAHVFSTDPPIPTPIFVVVRRDAEQLTLGPLKAGTYRWQIPCSDSTPIISFSQVSSPDPMNLPPGIGAAFPLSFSYPIWLWILIAVLVFTSGLVALWVFLKRRLKKRIRALQEQQQRQTLPPQQFENVLSLIELQDDWMKLEGEPLIELYAQSSHALRRYLEYQLEFSAHFATTTEFLDSFREAQLKRRIKKSQAEQQLFEVLTQSDRVRFSKLNPTKTERERYLQILRQLQKEFRPWEDQSA